MQLSDRTVVRGPEFSNQCQKAKMPQHCSLVSNFCSTWVDTDGTVLPSSQMHCVGLAPAK